MLTAATQYLIFYNVLLAIVLFTAISYTARDNKYLLNVSINKHQAMLLLVFMIMIIAWRDWESPHFGDSKVYGIKIVQAAQYAEVELWDDWGFNWLTLLWGKAGLSPELFFFFTASVYCLPMYIVSRRLAVNYAFVLLLFCVSSFSFYAFGVNGIRNGMASSIVLLAMVYRSKKWAMALLVLVAFSLHVSMILPLGAILITSFYKKTSFYLWFWLLSIVISLFTGKYFQTLFLNVDFISQYGGRYLSEAGSDYNYDLFSGTGFRWDFVMYSTAPIVIGYYTTQVKKLTNDTYSFFFNTYLVNNAIWILVINANYSNRIAYLSWFLMPIIIGYPVVKFSGFKYRNHVIAATLLTYYGFTYLLWVI
ncbi:MAG: EpsG family protein [Eubacteriales bacterium]